MNQAFSKILKITHYHVLVLVSLYLAFFSRVFADCADGRLCNPLRDGMGLNELVTYLVKDILVGLIAPIVITLGLLWSGFMFIQAQGKEAELATAKRNFFYVILGGVLLLGAYVILDVVTNTVGEITG